MANIVSRLTTWAVNQVLKSADLNGEFNNLVNVINNLNSGNTQLSSPQVSGDPTTALGIASKQYVDHYVTYRRPVLVYNSATVVNMETGINGTSGQARILFPDGTLRTDSTTGRIQCNLAQNAILSGAAQGGLDTGSVTANRWYSFYAVETSDNASNFVLVASLSFPNQATFATLNSNFGTNAWVYLGSLPNGDNSGATTSIPTFKMTGNRVNFTNTNTAKSSGLNGYGVNLANTAGSSVTWTYATGNTVGTQVPGHLSTGTFSVTEGTNSTNRFSAGGANSVLVEGLANASNPVMGSFIYSLSENITGSTNTGSPGWDIYLTGYWDGVLGVGSNPIL